MAILSATPVECMCGQSICTADEKYCSYTPSGAIGTVGQCNVGVFSVLHSGQCNDPGSNRGVIKDLDDCNSGSLAPIYPKILFHSLVPGIS